MGFHSFVILHSFEVISLCSQYFPSMENWLSAKSVQSNLTKMGHLLPILFLFFFFFLLHRANLRQCYVLQGTVPNVKQFYRCIYFCNKHVLCSFSKGWYFSPIKNLLKGEFQLFLHLTKDGRFLRNHSYFILLFRT